MAFAGQADCRECSRANSGLHRPDIACPAGWSCVGGLAVASGARRAIVALNVSQGRALFHMLRVFWETAVRKSIAPDRAGPGLPCVQLQVLITLQSL